MTRKSKREIENAVDALSSSDGPIGVKAILEWICHVRQEGADAMSFTEYVGGEIVWTPQLVRVLTPKSQLEEALNPAERYALRYMDQATREAVVARYKAAQDDSTGEP